MKQYTIRGVPEEIERMVREEAEKNGISINKAFVALLEKTLSKDRARRKQKHSHKDLDRLFGVWSKREYDRFDSSLKLQREIDEALWSCKE